MANLVFIKYPQSLLDTSQQDTVFPSDEEMVLTKDGAKTAKAVGANLSAALKGRFQVWTSPSRRCLDAAKMIARELGGKAVVEARLGERRILADAARITVGEFRSRQERGYLEPTRRSAGEEESPVAHRLRVEGWLAEILGTLQDGDIHVVVSHGAVVEHLHSSLCWKPAGAMGSSFTFCAPGHAHYWAMIELPDSRRIWCCLGANVDLSQAECISSVQRGLHDLSGLAVDLASDPRVQGRAGPPAPLRREVYYIR